MGIASATYDDNLDGFRIIQALPPDDGRSLRQVK
jgi:hypothetical protein